MRFSRSPLRRLAAPLALAVALAVALAACQIPSGGAEAPGSGLALEHGTSFGMCLGYCTTVLRIDADSTVLTLEPGGRGGTDVPARRFARATAPGRWAELAALAEVAPVAELPETIGCPDCADGGAEWIEVATADGIDRVTYEYGESLERAEALQEALRAERAAFDADVEAARAEAAPR